MIQYHFIQNYHTITYRKTLHFITCYFIWYINIIWYNIVFYNTIVFHIIQYNIILSDKLSWFNFIWMGIMTDHLSTITFISQVGVRKDIVLLASLIKKIRLNLYMKLAYGFKFKVTWTIKVSQNSNFSNVQTCFYYNTCTSIKITKTKFCIWGYLYLHYLSYINCKSDKVWSELTPVC